MAKNKIIEGQAAPDNSGAWLEQLLVEEPELTADEDANAALDEMQQDITAHVTSPVIARLLQWTGSESLLGDIVFPHLTTCSWCAGMLKEALELSEAPADHPLQALLEDVEYWIANATAGLDASKAAQRELLGQGIGYVYGREGRVFRRLPDGSEWALKEN